MNGLSWIFVACSLTTRIFTGTAFAADDVVVHRTEAFLEDGIPGKDAEVESKCLGDGSCLGGTRDGQSCSKDEDCPEAKDGRVVFDAGVHVVLGNYTVTGPFAPGGGFEPLTLYVAPGAIVKLGMDCTQDAGGEIVSCSPMTFEGGKIRVADGGVLQIEGAIVTDIRDDTVGGDTNKDGSATLPSPVSLLRFGGSENEFITDSTIRYAALIGHFGSIVISGSTFEKCGGLGSYNGNFGYDTRPPVRGSVPVIENNSFEIVTGTLGPGAMDLRGTSPIVWGNHFEGNGTAVVIGPQWESTSGFTDPIPEDGITIVAHNDIETARGIITDPPNGQTDTILQKVRFRADIHDNRLAGPGGNNSVGLQLATYSDTNARFNTVESYAIPLFLDDTGAKFPVTAETVGLIGLHLHGNSFSHTGAMGGPSVAQAVWETFHAYIDAENNWWGDATGPKDTSNADGLANPRGLGLALGNGVDYVPFLGKEPTSPLDSIHLRAQALPPAPLLPGLGDVVITPEIDDYTLASSATGTITVFVRDSRGNILNAPGLSKKVTSANHSVQFDAIVLDAVPQFSSSVTVEAVLVPDGSGGTEVRSNPKPFPILRPRGVSFRLSCVDDPGLADACDPISLVPGNPASLALRFAYSFSSGTVHGHYRLVQKERSTGNVLAASPTVSFTAPGSFAGQHSEFTMFTPPLVQYSELFRFLEIEYGAEDDDGVEIGGGSKSFDFLDYSNQIVVAIEALNDSGEPRSAWKGHLLVGEHPQFQYDVRYQIATNNVTNWQVNVVGMKALGANDAVLQAYPVIGVLEDLATGAGSWGAFLTTEEYPPLPVGTVKLSLEFQLYAPDQQRVIFASPDSFNVLTAESVVKKTIPAGPSEATFPGTGAKLTVTANPAPGAFTVEEIVGAITTNDANDSSLLSRRATLAGSEEKARLIPLNRSHALYDSLSDTGLSASITFSYTTDDFPDDPDFDEDSLVVAARNPLSGAFEVLPSTHDEAQHTVTAPYDSFFDRWTIASETSAASPACADPNADGNVTATDALFALRASVGSALCATCVCDVNNNGSISATDALLILRVAVGQIPTPACPACG